MDHQAFSQLLGNYREFVGALAVVATLLYLTNQVKQSNTAAETAAIQAFFDSTGSIAQSLGSKGDLIRRGIADWQSLTNDEHGDFNGLLLDWASKIHMGYRLRERKVLDEETYDSWESSVVSILRTPGGTEWWSNAKALWPNDFRQKIDLMVSDAGSDIPRGMSSCRGMVPPSDFARSPDSSGALRRRKKEKQIAEDSQS